MIPRKIPAVPNVAIRVGIPKLAMAIEFRPPKTTPIRIASTIGIIKLF